MFCNLELLGYNVLTPGKIVHEYDTKYGDIYAGFSENEGFIFSSGTDVYAVSDYGCCA